MFDNKWQRKEMPLVSLIGMGGGIASPAFLASIVLNILKPTVFSPADDTGVPDFDYTAESSAITNVNQISGGWSSASFDSNGESNQWKSVAYGNGKYVALALIGNAYLAANSTDGINWTSYNTIPYTSYSHLAYGNGAFVAVGQNKIVYSTDEGESWSSASVTSNWWKGVTYGDGKFVAVSEDGVNARVAISSDGVNWTGIPDTDGSAWQAVTYGGGKFVAVSQMGGVMYSSDGMNWSTTSATESAVWNSVAYGNGKFVAVASLKTMYSTDGINWFSGNNTVGYWKDITFGDGRFVAVSNVQDSSYPAAAGYSTDGDTWTPSNQAISGEWNGVDYVNGRFIAVAGIGTPKIMWSPTGIDEATVLTLTDTTVSKVFDGSLIEGESIDQVLTVGETVQADTAVTGTVTVPVFSTDLWDGNDQNRTITTGLDMSGEGGMVWLKRRDAGTSHLIYDTERGAPYHIEPDWTSAQSQFSGFLTGFVDDGFTIGTGHNINSTGSEHVAWSFRKAPGFFNIVTWNASDLTTGDYMVNHNLGTTPGMILCKNLNNGSAPWYVYHKDVTSSSSSDPNAHFLYLNESGEAIYSSGMSDPNSDFGGWAVTDTQFRATGSLGLDNGSDNFIAYVFADNPSNSIKCGGYSATGTNNTQSINFGFRPGWLMVKMTSNNENYLSSWIMVDSERGTTKQLPADNAQAEFDQSGIVFTDTGIDVTGWSNRDGWEYVYVAIAENAESDITTQSTASGMVSASSGNTITLSDVSGTWSTGMKVQGVTTDAKDNPDPIKVEDVSLTSSAPTAERNVNTWGDAVWEIATDENFTQNVQTSTTALSATGTQAGPSFTLERETGYYTRTKYTALGQESEWSDVTYFVTKGLPVYADEVFSTYLYEGTGSTQSINNGIDLSGEGGLVWIKSREMQRNHGLYDTERGVGRSMTPTGSTGQTGVDSTSLNSFNSNGFSVGTDTYSTVNESTKPFVSWSFRKAPGFFDVVTYTGSGSARTVSHNLGSVPGMIIVKAIDDTAGWYVYHRSLGNTGLLRLNVTNASTSTYSQWNQTDPTASVFSLAGQGYNVNESNVNYIAYIFAHDDQSFGTNGNESIIKCGSYTGNAGTKEVDLGFEPQWLMIKNSTSSSDSYGNADWTIVDNMRGASTGTSRLLYTNLSNVEGYGGRIFPTPTGFKIDSESNIDYNASGDTYVYMAIRRPHKPATVVTDLFAIDYGSSASSTPTWDSGFPVDFGIVDGVTWASRLTGSANMDIPNANAESSNGSYSWDSNVGWGKGYGSTVISYMFKRSPGFMDVVTYKGTGSPQAINHNLGVAPEFLVVKHRGGNYNWFVYDAINGPTKYLLPNQLAESTAASWAWNNTAPTSTQFTVGDGSAMNDPDDDFIAYLFATQPGISKVGSYTGNGANGAQQVDCGFTNGAAFILVKNASSSGDWYLLDSERGINAYNESDVYTLMNVSGVSQTGNVIGYHNVGFMVAGQYGSPLNNAGETYIFLAIANP